MMNETESETSIRSDDRLGTSTSSTSLAPTIHDFDILKPISRGAFGKVFLCNRKDAPDKKLAVKVMKKNEMVQKNMVDQVIAERNALAITKSPFVVGLLYCLQTVNNVFLVMEYMIGGDLKSLLSVYGFLEEGHAVFYFAECVLALKYLHNRGIVHRDIKPDNMLISHTGHLKLTDFGLSSTGMRDKELHVADLVAKTPFPAGSKAHRERLIRTPGQILSLTSHLSFSNATGDYTGDSYTGGSYTVRDSTSHTCDVSEYGRHVSGASGVHLSTVSQHEPVLNMSVGDRCQSRCQSSMSAVLPGPLVTTPGGKMSCDNVTPVQSSRVRLVRKNSFSEAMARHVKETGAKEPDLSRKVLDRKVGHHSTSPDPKLNSSALQPLPNSSFDFGPNKTIEFAHNLSQDQDQHDEVFEEDKENLNLIVPSSPLKYIPSSPPMTQPAPSEGEPFSLNGTPSPPYDLNSILGLDTLNEDSRGSMSSSPKNNQVKRFSPDQLTISPLKPVTMKELRTGPEPCDADMSTPVTAARSEQSAASVARENMRCLRDVDNTLSPEILRGDCSYQSWDSDIHLERPVTDQETVRREERTQSEMEISQTGIQSQMDFTQDSVTSVVSRTLSPLPNPGILSPGNSNMTPPNFKIPVSQAGGEPFISLKRKCSDSPGEEPDGHGRTQLTGDLTDLVITKKVRLDPASDPGIARSSISSSSSGSSEEEGRQGYGFSTPVQQYSTPLSAVPQHMKQFKGMKAVKFVSPAGLTPVQHAEMPTSPKQPLKMPFSLAELDVSAPPATPTHFPPSPMFKTPCHPSPQQTPLRTPKSMPRPRRTTEPSRILGTPDYLAPELLRGQGHGKEVDWWALGACLYEFMTGIPPFNDESPEMVFENILSLNIEWPEGDEALSPAAVHCIMSLLVLDPGARADDVTLMTETELTRTVDWASILDQEPPFVPAPDSATDTTYFHAKNNIQGLRVSSVDI